MNMKLQNREKGFTIIEVLIVLAIAGLIVLIVFLAVPSLQRNSRNTQRKNDVSRVVGAVQEFTNNNQGKLPAGGDYDAVKQSAKPSFYDDDQVDIDTEQTGANDITPNIDNVIVRNYAKCPADVPAEGNVETNTNNATKRNVVAVYQIETSGGVQNQCQDM